MKPNKQKGFTLLEVVLTLAFIGVMLVLYASALGTVTLSKKLRYENYAYHIANKKMEELRLVQYTALVNGGNVIVDPMLAQLPSGSGTYHVLDHAGFNGLKEITVTVAWNDGTGKQVQLKTLIGSGGINP